VLIDRTTSLGNPYVIGRDGDRGQVIAAFARYVVHRPDLMALLPGLRGRVLGCHCAPLPCHGDVLARLADASRYLAPGSVCTGYWYAIRGGMLPYGGPADPDDREFLAGIGLRAGRLAHWHGLSPSRVTEGPGMAVAWPGWVWGVAADVMAQHAAEHGDYGDPADVVTAYLGGTHGL
jgi:hypothetical protein